MLTLLASRPAICHAIPADGMRKDGEILRSERTAGFPWRFRAHASTLDRPSIKRLKPRPRSWAAHAGCSPRPIEPHPTRPVRGAAPRSRCREPILIDTRSPLSAVETPLIPTIPRASVSLSTLTSSVLSSMPRMAACIAMLVAVHEAIEARRSQPGFGAASPPPMARGMSLAAFSPWEPVISHCKPCCQTAVADELRFLAASGRWLNTRRNRSNASRTRRLDAVACSEGADGVMMILFPDRTITSFLQRRRTLREWNIRFPLRYASMESRYSVRASAFASSEK